MIGTININCNAANPNMPLKTIFSFVNSPTSIRIIDTPKKIGTWNITSVKIQATYPDNSIVSADCVLTGGCWTGTIQGSTSVGKSLNGYMVTADGIDEHGNDITGYILGKGDVVILDADSRTVIGDKMYYLHLLDNVPTNPQKGDVVQSDDNWLIHDGTDWALFGGASWGQITGDITQQTDLQSKFESIDTSLADVVVRIAGVQSDVREIGASKLDTRVAYETFADKESIEPTAPSTEASDDALAGAKSTADFVNSSINNFAAFYITRDEDGNAFPSKTSLLDATVFYSGGQQRVPTKNDYCIVLSDGSHPTPLGEPTTRYTYQGTYPNGQWEFQYIVNNTSLTQAQVNAINSGITAQKVAKIDTIQDYTPLSTFNDTLGNLSSIIQGI